MVFKPFTYFLFFCSTAICKASYISIDSTLIHINYSKQGQTTVIFEAGMGEGISNWNSIPDSVSMFSSVLSYDRPGIGQSEETKQSASIVNMANRLSKIIDTLCPQDSIIIVAHSMGGYIARYFTSKFPNKVKAVILIDPSPEQVYTQMTNSEIQQYLAHGNKVFATKSKGAQQEWKSYITNSSFIEKANVKLDVPTIIFSSTGNNFFELHKLQLSNNKGSKHIEIEGNHWFHLTQKELITNTIYNLIKQAL